MVDRLRSLPAPAAPQRRAFTLLELLVSIAVIGILIAMLLPAVVTAREAARRTSCVNHLKQIALGALKYEGNAGKLPGYYGERAFAPKNGHTKRRRDVWNRDPKAKQEGNWLLQVMRHMELERLADQLAQIGTASRSYGKPNEMMQRDPALRSAFNSGVAVLHCPSRRAAKAYPIIGGKIETLGNSASRFDYAICKGSAPPDTIARGLDTYSLLPPQLEGVWRAYVRTKLEQIVDGTTHTYLVGEKAMDPRHYEDGFDLGDREPLSGCVSCRFSRGPAQSRRLSSFAATADTNGSWADLHPETGRCADIYQPFSYDRFGSAHPTTWNMAFVDGSVRSLAYDMDLTLHRAYGSINGEEVVSRN